MLQTLLRWKLRLVAPVVCSITVSTASAQQPAPQTPPADTPQAPEALPADYEAPRTVPPVMTFDKELTTQQDNDKLYGELRSADKYTIVFSNAQLNNSTKAIVEKWAKWRLHQMTLKSNRQRLHEVRDELMRDVGYAGRSPGVPRKQVEEFRNFLCEEVVKRATELLKNNFHVRLNATIVLAQLNLTDYDRRKEIPEQAYVKAAIPLLEILQTKTGGGLDEQLEAIKIQAAIGLKRINLLGAPGDLNISVKDQNLRNYMAKVIIAELQNANTHPWYQKRLIEALASIDLVNDVNTGRPIILQELSEVLVDSKRDICVRARAARALGRCSLPGGVNVEKLVYQILALEYEMALAYQKSPDAFQWHDCFADLYFAFHPVSEDEIALFGKRPAGLNRNQQVGAAAGEAYQQLLPIVKHVVSQPGWSVSAAAGTRSKNAPIPDQMIADLTKWLQDHQPASHKLTPNLPDLAPGPAVPTAKAGATASGT